MFTALDSEDMALQQAAASGLGDDTDAISPPEDGRTRINCTPRTSFTPS